MPHAVKKVVRKVKPLTKVSPGPANLRGAISRAKIPQYRDAKVTADDRRMYQTELLRLQGDMDKVTRGLMVVKPSIPERITQLKSLLQ